MHVQYKRDQYFSVGQGNRAGNSERVLALDAAKDLGGPFVPAPVTMDSSGGSKDGKEKSGKALMARGKKLMEKGKVLMAKGKEAATENAATEKKPPPPPLPSAPSSGSGIGKAATAPSPEANVAEKLPPPPAPSSDPNESRRKAQAPTRRKVQAYMGQTCGATTGRSSQVEAMPLKQ